MSNPSAAESPGKKDDDEPPVRQRRPSIQPPTRSIKAYLAKISAEFDQISMMLDKEINHRVHLEETIASLRGELEKDAELRASEGITSPKSGSSPDKTNGQTHYKAGEVHYEAFKVAEGAETSPPKSTGTEEITLQEKKEDDRKASFNSKEEHHEHHEHVKTRREEQLEELELIKGWQTLGDQYVSDSARHLSNVVAKVGVFRAHARKIVESQPFDAMCATAIIYNAALLGAAGDYAARHHTDPNDPPMFYKVSDRICTVWFLAELLLRIGSEGIRDFIMGPLWSWNLFDFIVVFSDVMMSILDAIATEAKVDFSFLRMLRVLRVTRAIRVVRLVRFFKELRMMVFSVLRSGTSLLWSLILFGIIIYIFGIFLMQQVTDYLWDQYEGEFSSVQPNQQQMVDNFDLYWGNLSRAMYTMYACMSSGVSWKDVADDLHEISWINSTVMGFFIFFCTIVVMNIITGIFVDTAIMSAQSDRDEIVQEQIHSQESELAKLKGAFLEADNDGSGTITILEFEEHLKDAHVRAHLASIGLEIHEAMGLFKLLDIDGSGAVGIEEFVIGCMRLKGSAKSIDLATLMYENKRMVEQHSHFHDYCTHQFNKILDVTETLRLEISFPVLAKQGDNQYLC